MSEIERPDRKSRLPDPLNEAGQPGCEDVADLVEAFCRSQNLEERLELLGNVLADNDYDSFKAVEQHWLDQRQQQDPGNNPAEAPDGPEEERFAYARELFEQRQGVTGAMTSIREAGRIIGLAQEQAGSENLGAIDGHLLAALATNRLHAETVKELVHLITVEAHDKTLVGGRELIDRLLESNSFDYDDLADLLLKNACNYSLEADRQPSSQERPKWLSLKHLSEASHRDKQQLFEAIRTQQVFSPEWFSDPEAKRLANDLDLAPAGRETFLGADPTVHDLGTRGMSLGLKLEPDFIDDFVQLPPTEQRVALRQLDSQLNRRVLDNLAWLEKSDGWYCPPPEHQIHIVKHPAKSYEVMLAAAGHELLHAADYSADQDSWTRLLEAVATYLKAHNLTSDEHGRPGLVGSITKSLAGRIAGSSNNHDLPVDNDGGDSELHFLQLVHQLPRIEGEICFQGGQRDNAERFLSEAIAYLGTEMVDVPAELEDYCGLIFNNRREMVARLQTSDRPDLPEPKIVTWRQRLGGQRSLIKQAHNGKNRFTSTPIGRDEAVEMVVEACKTLEKLQQEIDDEVSRPDYNHEDEDWMCYLSNRSQMAIRQAFECLYDIRCR